MERHTDTGRLYELLFGFMRKCKQQMSAEGGSPMTYLHLETLRFLAEAARPDMGEVAAYLRVAAPSATAIVNALADDGLIARKPDPEDRRRVLLAVTAKGDRALEAAGKRRAEAFARIIEPLSAADRSEFARILTIITER
jgi:DNA-binding MarR family transcriptional regulator